jgi:hypothetical protein
VNVRGIVAVCLLGVLGAAPGQAARAAPKWTIAQASAALRRVHVWNHNKTSGFVAQVVCLDFNRDGHTDMAATAGTSGSAGVAGWAAFLSAPSGWKVVQRQPLAYEVKLVKLGHDLLEYRPFWLPGDAHCCPTGGSFDRLFRWNGRRLALAFSWRQKR